MSLNPFLGWTQPQLEAALQKAQSDFSSGKTVIEAEVPGTRVKNQLELTITERIRQILRALNLLDPTHYPADQISPSSTTRIVFGPGVQDGITQ